MRPTILTLSIIGCIISTSFALENNANSNEKLDKRQVEKILLPVTGGGVGTLGDINGFGGFLGGKQASAQQKRSLEERGLIPGLDLLTGLVGGAASGPADAPAPPAQPQSHSQHYRHSRPHAKRGLIPGLDLLTGIIGGGDSGPAAAPAAAPAQHGARPQHQRTRYAVKKRDNGKDGLEVAHENGNLGIAGNHKASQRHRKRGLPLGLDGILGGVLGGASPAPAATPSQEQSQAVRQRHSSAAQKRDAIGGSGGSQDFEGQRAKRHHGRRARTGGN